MIIQTPVQVTWSFTKKCNLSCAFCLIDAGKEEKDAISLEERNFILSELIDGKALKVILTGGEPLCEPEVFKIIETLRKNNIAVELTTNGTLLNNDIIVKLISCGIKEIQISINGSKAEINDILMGTSFKKIINAVTLCLKKGINLHTKTTLTSLNISDIPSMVILLKKLGIKKIDLDEVVPMGRALLNYRKLKPSQKELSKLDMIVDKMNTEDSICKTNFSSFTLSMRDDGRAAECSIGEDNSYCCTITSDGNLYPCTLSALWRKKNSIINKGLRKSWNDTVRFRDYLDTHKLEGKCGICVEKTECKGGCRALAYALTGSIWNEYPLCPAL